MGIESTNQQPITEVNQLKLPQSILGTTLPILIGQRRITWKLLWYGAFRASKAKQQGGSGLAKGGVEYVYSASVIGSLCMGDCLNFLSVWDNIGRYAMQSYSETTTLPPSGSITFTPTNQSTFKQDMGVSLVQSYSYTANDYGSPSAVTLTGTHYVPLVYTTNPTPPAGQYTIQNPPGSGQGGGPDASFTLTSVANASGGTTVYTGVITGGNANAFAGYIFTVAGYSNSENNGQFQCSASSSTTLTLGNPNGIAESVAVATATIVSSTPVYIFNSAQANAQVIVSYVAYRYQIQQDELQVIPSGGTPVVVQYQANQPLQDLGVKYYPSGVALTSTSGTPGTGQYNPSGGGSLGKYTFASSGPDIGQGIVISYTYTDSNTDANAPNVINLTFFSGALGQSPWSYLSSSFPSAALGYSETCYIASSGLYLGFSPVLPEYNFEIAGPYAFGGGIPDANPADAIYGLLTDPAYKLSFPYTNISSSLLGTYSITGSVTSGSFTSGEVVKQTSTGAAAIMIGTVTSSNPLVVGPITGPVDATHTWVGQTSAAVYTPSNLPASSSVRAQWSSNNFFISEILDSRQPLMSILSNWCEAGQVYMSFDEGILKFIPLVDTTTIANGTVYNPPTQPIIDLDDNDFVVEKNKDPIEISQTPWQNRWNRIQIGWSVRSNDYNSDVYQVQDEASVQDYYLQQESKQEYSFITTLPAAQFAGNMRLQRYSAIYTTFKFTLKANFAFLSPGDIITVTDGLLGTSGTLFGRTPVRITKMTDDPEKGVIIEAENFPWSVGAALIYNAQAQLPSNTNDGPQENPGDTTALIFEIPNRAALYGGTKIYIFANGANSNWGGFEAWVSFNGVDYNFYGQYDTPGRIGVTTADFPLHVDPDNTNTLTVNMQQSGATLQSVTAADRDAFVTLSGIVSPGDTFNEQNTATAGANIGTSTGGGTTTGSAGPNSFATGENESILSFTGVAQTGFSTLTSISESGTTVTVKVASSGVNFLSWSQVGDTIQIAGCPVTGYNGNWAITAKVDYQTFQFTNPTSGLASATSGNCNFAIAQYENGSSSGSGPLLYQQYAITGSGLLTNFQGLHRLVTFSTVFGATSYYFYIGTFGNGTDSHSGTASFGGAAWTNPGNITNPTSYATVNLNSSVQGGVYSTNLWAEQPNLNISTGIGSVIGLQVALDAYVSAHTGSPQINLNITLLYNKTTVGSTVAGWNPASFPTSPTTINLGASNSIAVWGLPAGFLTPTVLNSSLFGIQIETNIVGTGVTATVNVKNAKITATWSSGGNATGWTNPQNVASVVSYATCTLTTSNVTQWLLAHTFDFLLPFGFSLSGIQVDVNASTAITTGTLSTILYYDYLQVGQQLSTSINSTPTNYTFGGPTNEWGTDGFFGVDQINANGLSGFGVQFMASGAAGDTVSINNVRITIYGTSTSNLELISYEFANLVGENTYALTSIRRGVYGTYPCDHPAGSDFARIDQATLVYSVDPTFTGNTIYFKFLSFNSYGYQLQSLANVTAYAVPINGLAPGAIDAASGALLTGTPNFTVPKLEAATSAVHGTFGIDNIPAGYSLVGPNNGASGTPVWTAIITGGGGDANVMNFFGIETAVSMTAAAWDFIEVDTTAGNITITFPAALSNPDTLIGVKKISSDAHTVTLATTGGDTIEVSTISQKNQSFYLGSDGVNANWFIVCDYTPNPLPAALPGNILRYNVNGDNTWDFVPFSHAALFDGVVAVLGTNSGVAIGFGNGTPPAFLNGGVGTSWVYHDPTLSIPYPRTTSTYGGASANTCIGVSHWQSGNSGVFHVKMFWSLRHKLAISPVTHTRYWWGLAVWANGSSLGQNGTNFVNPSGTSTLCTDTPNRTMIAWRWSDGTDTNFKACVIQAGGSSVIVDTGVAADSSQHTFDVLLDQAFQYYTFYIDGVQVAQIAASTLTFNPTNDLDAYGSIFYTGDNKNNAAVVACEFGSMFIDQRH